MIDSKNGWNSSCSCSTDKLFVKEQGNLVHLGFEHRGQFSQHSGEPLQLRQCILQHRFCHCTRKTKKIEAFQNHTLASQVRLPESGELANELRVLSIGLNRAAYFVFSSFTSLDISRTACIASFLETQTIVA